MGKDLQIE